ncbi:SecE [Desulforapulum autotrophicum HRM2]|uniref:Protein translocase subunit SecE n=1 Tax=Desulforapulum autotrophicum (strain ATCC 43914 / DSM 3382 / VKM B-1955 / HRM2) TaxID=177437 RepID=C0Q9Y5_DESAH|nr:SecE [Desulforapulum autotrophicum HRM2]
MTTDKSKARVQEDQDLERVSGDKGTELRVKPAPQVLKSKTPPLTNVVAGRENFYHQAVRFFREVRVELKKVTWPNQKQTAGSTVVVIILVFILAAFLGLVDFGLSKLVQVVLA